MKATSILSALALSSLFASAAPAQSLDASKPMRCALTRAAECDEETQCSNVAVADIELPEVVRVDFAAKLLVSPDRQRTSPISAVEVLDAVLVLQGHQSGRGWTMVIERPTGHMSATVTDADGVFVLAGGCTAE